MAAPKVKMYLLPPTYSEGGDDDVQRKDNDELMPVVPKQEALNTVKRLTGVWPADMLPCYPINIAAGRVTQNLTGGPLIYTPATNAAEVLISPSGYFRMWVEYIWGQEIPSSGYVVGKTGVVPNESLVNITFLTAPSGSVRLNYWKRASTPCADWALPASSPYLGPNSMVGKVIVYPSGSGFPSVPVAQLGTPVGASGAYIHLAANALGMRVHYWWMDPSSHYFAADDCNWVKDHLRMNPDIFVGDIDYPGDSGETNGVPFTQGIVPKFRDIGTYQIEHRIGYVKFPEVIDSFVNPVRANYSYHPNVRNVDGINLTVVGSSSGRKYATSGTDLVYPEAHQKPLVNRDDPRFPFNVYVNGTLVGAPKTYSPYDVLTVKTS
jgi:hypothetical protein